jgi:FkbH-like protein
MDVEERIAFFEEAFKSTKLNDLEPIQLITMGTKFVKIEHEYLKKHAAELVVRKVAVLASHTTHQFITQLRLFLYKMGISPVFFEGDYNSIYSDIMDEDSSLYRFTPDILVILTQYSDVKEYPPLLSSNEEVNSWVKEKSTEYSSLWINFNQIMPGCQIFHSLFITPFERQLGNMEVNYPFSRTNCISRLNQEFSIQKPSYVTLLDFNYLASSIGLRNWFDEVNYYMNKQGFSITAGKLISTYLSKLIGASVGKVNKCLVLDLDNTLWGGVIGDDGLDGINLDPNHPIGEAFLAFQNYVLKLQRRGVLLAICSKNDEKIAKEVFLSHSNMLMRLSDIALFVANWDDKVTNIKTIAANLNIGLNSVVFFDDNPAERQIVVQFLPEVEVIDVPKDPALYIRALESTFSFEWLQLTGEDLIRSETYHQDAERKSFSLQFSDYNSYLQSLNLTAQVSNLESKFVPRFSQLINKTNQFNIRTKRYTEAMVIEMMANANHQLIYFSHSDKFSNYGIVSCLILIHLNNVLFIDTWVMSCRVLKRQLEHLAMNVIYDIAKRSNCELIIGEYIPTEKNGLVHDLFEKFGFEVVNSRTLMLNFQIEGTLFVKNVSDIIEAEHHILVENEFSTA